MRMKHVTVILTVAVAMLLIMTAGASAESTKVDGHCWFDGGETIVSNDFSDDTIATSIRGLEPGDDVTFRVEYKNKYKDTTYWYMKSEVLKTLEDSYDRSENGGYTFTLANVDPKGNREILFSNDTVGGESKPGNMEGLHQATNATKEWFFIQELKTGEEGYTELEVKFDGDTEVNDYMDTYGKLKVAYAVEMDENNSGTHKTTSDSSSGRTTKTGDDSSPITMVLAMILSLLLAAAVVWSYRRDQRKEKGGDQA